MWAGDEMVFGGTNCSFRRVGGIKGRDVLEGEVDREEKRSEVRRGLVFVKRDVR